MVDSKIPVGEHCAGRGPQPVARTYYPTCSAKTHALAKESLSDPWFKTRNPRKDWINTRETVHSDNGI